MNITREQIINVFKENKTDKLSLHRYDRMYYEIFNKLNPIKKLLEIGVKEGYSLGAWVDLFPEAEISGVDITLHRVSHEKAKKAILYEHDAVSPLVRDVIKDTFDVIIDDGSHHPNDQWYSFLTFEDRWTQCYIIEDVIGYGHVKMFEKYLNRKQYRYDIFQSAKRDAVYQMGGEQKTISFYAIAIYPKS
jgi:hypothetical protein